MTNIIIIKVKNPIFSNFEGGGVYLVNFWISKLSIFEGVGCLLKEVMVWVLGGECVGVIHSLICPVQSISMNNTPPLPSRVFIFKNIREWVVYFANIEWPNISLSKRVKIVFWNFTFQNFIWKTRFHFFFYKISWKIWQFHLCRPKNGENMMFHLWKM